MHPEHKSELRGVDPLFIQLSNQLTVCLGQLCHRVIRALMAMSLENIKGVFHILALGKNFQVVQAIVPLDSRFVIWFRAFWDWTYESLHDKAMDFPFGLLVVPSKVNRGIPLFVNQGFKNEANAGAHGNASAPNSALVADLVDSFPANNLSPSFHRADFMAEGCH